MRRRLRPTSTTARRAAGAVAPLVMAALWAAPVRAGAGEPAPMSTTRTPGAAAADICGVDDTQYVNAYDGTLGQTREFVAAHKPAVGALVINWEGRLEKNASGTLIGSNVFLTCAHCVDTLLLQAGMWVSFSYELSGGPGSAPLQEELFRVVSVVEHGWHGGPTPVGLDFAVLRLEGDPGAKYGWTDIAESPTQAGELITVIQHPVGDYKKVEVGHILPDEPGNPLREHTRDRIYYDDLDGEVGSSGSGILNAEGRLVGVHTNGPCDPALGWANSGLRMTRALEESTTLSEFSRGIHWRQYLDFCTQPGGRTFVGDFNGDGRDDLLCHDGDGTKATLLANRSGQFCALPETTPELTEACGGYSLWSSAMGWCVGETARLHVGDFNGDGRDDMLCREAGGAKRIALATRRGRFTNGTSWSGLSDWCSGAGDRLLVGDLNGDGRADLLCHGEDGLKRTALAGSAGRLRRTTWSGLAGWCSDPQDQLLAGDFNGDRRADLLCHASDGSKWTALANSAGRFAATSESPAMTGWCTHAGAELFLGDFNGDGRSDLLCHDLAGNKWTALADPAGGFGGTSWSAAMQWCGWNGARLAIGSFNTDGRSDMLCRVGGHTWLSNARPDGSF